MALPTKAVMKKPGAKAMKAAKKTRVSKIARGKRSKAMVCKGSKEKTAGGLQASDITRNRYGKLVAKKASERSKNNAWPRAIASARRALGLTGFILINKGPEGKALYAKAKEIHAA
mmetsp:Transcript_18672/g.58687  ORF Transcript_18672/g.58687 Transcript_18672/m.58687 type:complete len:116 (-) Transcript_18672:235-582(-)|eukprot:CAMPEP_0175313982 /NCGR_PEP_ID=MMETSP0093-20121207/68160_1 /TAXON_ID=311494 /ORGANISM="Alexandrium monilatum, Strain CCMP3105" /LENGTH=115 /DNA_ID=CAMNT_0016610697 /DNA_START=73 /DNA_END=420 /DNA_ORIENTATION=+